MAAMQFAHSKTGKDKEEAERPLHEARERKLEREERERIALELAEKAKSNINKKEKDLEEMGKS